MEQSRAQRRSGEQLSFSEQLTQHIADEAFDVAEVFARAAQSYPANRRRQCIRIALSVAAGVVIGALAMYFLLANVRWILL